MDRIKKEIRKRANRMWYKIKDVVLPALKEGRSFYIAGGCLAGKVNDIDIFPHSSQTFATEFDLPILSKTKNAITYDFNPAIQECHYYFDRLETLVQSFDFAHIQVGAEFDCCGLKNIYYTQDFVQAQAINSTWYLYSKYPLSSLIRAGKYYNRGLFSRGQYINCTLKILVDVIQKGFSNYEDFKDQLDAVDLGMLPEDFKDLQQSADLLLLFELLKKKENV